MSTSSQPKVSIVVSTYNQEKYIGDCLRSLIEQEFDQPYEIVVSDDCSTDRTGAIVREIQGQFPSLIRVLENPRNQGPFLNYLTVHSQARGVYVAHMDGDDLAAPDKLQKQVDYLDSHPQCNVVWHRMRFFDDSRETVHPPLVPEFVDHRYYRSDLYLLGPFGPHSSTMYRRKHFDLKSFSGKCDDWFMSILYLADGYGVMLPDVLGGYRIHATSMSSGAKATRSNRELSTASQRMALALDRHARSPVATRALANFLLDAIHLRSYCVLSLKVFASCRTLPQLHAVPRLFRFYRWSRLPALFREPRETIA